MKPYKNSSSSSNPYFFSSYSPSHFYVYNFKKLLTVFPWIAQKFFQECFGKSIRNTSKNSSILGILCEVSSEIFLVISFCNLSNSSKTSMDSLTVHSRFHTTEHYNNYSSYSCKHFFTNFLRNSDLFSKEYGKFCRILFRDSIYYFSSIILDILSSKSS